MRLIERKFKCSDSKETDLSLSLTRLNSIFTLDFFSLNLTGFLKDERCLILNFNIVVWPIGHNLPSNQSSALHHNISQRSLRIGCIFNLKKTFVTTTAEWIYLKRMKKEENTFGFVCTANVFSTRFTGIPCELLGTLWKYCE